jgi:hypothetical protein
MTAKQKKAQGGAQGKKKAGVQIEPRDKTSREWRTWKLRQLRRAFGPARLRPTGGEAYGEAWQEFYALLDGVRRSKNLHTGLALRLLPALLDVFQYEEEFRQADRRSDAARRGAETRKARAAKKGGE